LYTNKTIVKFHNRHDVHRTQASTADESLKQDISREGPGIYVFTHKL
jgi:hypothetical protein